MPYFSSAQSWQSCDQVQLLIVFFHKPESPANAIAGFKTCGMYPLNREAIKIPVNPEPIVAAQKQKVSLVVSIINLVLLVSALMMILKWKTCKIVLVLTNSSCMRGI